jgi:hypothetical protein
MKSREAGNQAMRDPGYPAALQYRDNLISRFPELRKANLQP